MSLVDLGKRLLDAAKRGDTEEVRAMMANGAPFTTDWLGTSPLHFAAQHGHNQTAEVLLRAGISRDARTKVDRTPLHIAAQEGHTIIVELLLQNSADIDAKDMLKMTPLHWATEKGHLPVVDLLLRHGADVVCENKFDKTPLEIAVSTGKSDIAHTLQMAQIDGNIQDPNTEIREYNDEMTTGEETVTMIESDEVTETVTTSSTPPIHTENSNHIHKGMISEDAEGKASSSDPSSTSVLATLAALAEATAPISATNTSTSEAMTWLESQGITMISGNDSSLISSAIQNGQPITISENEGGILASAMESGHSITLTEAGKIALNVIKQSLNSNTGGSHQVVEAIEEEVVTDDQQKVITLVTTDGSLPEDEDGNVLVVATDVDGKSDIDEPPAKRARQMSKEADILDDESAPVDVNKWLLSSVKDENHEALQKQLREVRRQAEQYKKQLQQKEQEAEVYKKQLNQMSASSKSPSSSS